MRRVRAIILRKKKSASGAMQAVMRGIIMDRNLGAVVQPSAVVSFTGVLNVDPPVGVVCCRY